MIEDDFSNNEINALFSYVFSLTDDQETENYFINTYGSIPKKIKADEFDDSIDIYDSFFIDNYKKLFQSTKTSSQRNISLYKKTKNYLDISIRMFLISLIAFIPLILLQILFFKFSIITILFLVYPQILGLNIVISSFIELIFRIINLHTITPTDTLFFFINEKRNPELLTKHGLTIKWNVAKRIKKELLEEVSNKLFSNIDLSKQYTFNDYFIFFCLSDLIIDINILYSKHEDLYLLGKKSLEMCLLADQNSVFISYMLGYYNMKLGCNADALFYFRKVHDHYPKYRISRFYIEFIEYIDSINNENLTTAST